MLKKYLKDKNIIITDSLSKRKVIEELNENVGLIQYKVLTQKEFLDNYFFSYDKKTIKYIVENYKLNVETALEYLNMLVYIEDKNYNNHKLNYLLEIKKDLENNNLLYTNELFRNTLKNNNIIIYDCKLDPFIYNILSSYQIIDLNEEIEPRKLTIYEFNNIEDEIAYVCYDIKKRLDAGYDINKIKIINSDETYENVLKRIFKWSNIPLDYQTKISLYDLPVGKKIIKDLQNNKQLNDILEEIEIYEDIYNKIVNIFNDYIIIGTNIDMIIYDLKNTYIHSKHLTNSVNIINIYEAKEENINYLIGFNKENYPKIYKDEDIISDNLKKELGLLTTNDKNIFEIKKLLNNLYKYNYVITYKLKDAFNIYNKQLLFKEEEINLIKNPQIEYNFSNTYNKEKLGIEYDNYYKYGIISPELITLKENYSDLDYDTYDNKFTGINKDNYLNSFDKMSVSYSSIDNYFRCAFRYYLNSIIKVDSDNTNESDDNESDDFYMNIGKIFHYVLSKYRDKNFDFDNAWNEEADKHTYTLDKLLFLENLKKELKYDIEIIKKQENLTNMHKYLFEERINVNIKNKYDKKVRFTGVVDKIIYDEFDKKTLVSIVDYKTGRLHTDINNMIYGIGMQLPIYLYLIKRSNLFPNSIIVGFYLQKILNKDERETIKKNADDLKEEKLKLVGYSNEDQDILKEFDYSYAKSNLIYALKCNKDGSFNHNSKILTTTEMGKIESLVSDVLEEGINDILEAKFDINPKKINDKEIGCEYCKYKDICFRQEKDYKELPRKNIKEYLEGDNND